MNGKTKRPVGSRFIPNDLGLVRLYLRNMVEKNESSFITVMNIYKDEPWLLDHVQNELFKENEWYYFVPRKLRGGNTPNRTVPGRGESEGGWWKSTGVKTDIKDHKKNLIGYKQSLVYRKKVKGKRDGDKTDWLMTEYSLKGNQFQDWVLCWIRDKTEKRSKHQIVDHAPQVENNMDNVILPNQVQEEVSFTDFANWTERMMLHGEHDNISQQQQQQQQDTSILPPTNDNNFMMMLNQEPFQWNDFGFDGAEDVMVDIDEFLEMIDDITQQQQQ